MDTPLHHKFGATFGKNQAEIKVVSLEGLDLTIGQAIIRSLPALIYAVLLIIGNLIVTNNFQENIIIGKGIFEATKFIQIKFPLFINFFMAIVSLWFIVDALVLIINKNRRSLHDVIAKTMVISSSTKIKW